jgi:hypothetical protein
MHKTSKYVSLQTNGLAKNIIFLDVQNMHSQEEESDDDAVTAQPQSGAAQNMSSAQQPIFAMPAPGAAIPTSTVNENTNLNSGGDRVIYTTGITSS